MSSQNVNGANDDSRYVNDAITEWATNDGKLNGSVSYDAASIVLNSQYDDAATNGLTNDSTATRSVSVYAASAVLSYQSDDAAACRIANDGKFTGPVSAYAASAVLSEQPDDAVDAVASARSICADSYCSRVFVLRPKSIKVNFIINSSTKLGFK